MLKFIKSNYPQILGFIISLFIIAMIVLALHLNHTHESPLPKQSVVKKETESKLIPPQKTKVKNFSLKIERLGISAPIIPNVDGADKKEYFKALQKGVAHFQGTKFPGQGGNIFIFGHSSYYASDPGKYKEVFRDLNDLKIGEKIEILFNDKKYLYFVKSKKIIEPTATEYLKDTKNERLTLMTCWPPGTYIKRLVIIAKAK